MYGCPTAAWEARCQTDYTKATSFLMDLLSCLAAGRQFKAALDGRQYINNQIFAGGVRPNHVYLSGEKHPFSDFLWIRVNGSDDPAISFLLLNF